MANVINLESAVDCVATSISADKGDILAVGQTTFTGRWWTGSVSVFSWLSGGPVGRAKADLRAGVGAVDWLPNLDSSSTRTVVTGSDDGSIDLWQYTPGVDASQPAQLHHLEGKAAHDNIVSGIAAALTGSRVASSAWDLSVRLWDTLAFVECCGTLVGHSDIVHSVAWGQDGNTLISASQDCCIKQWDTRHSSCVSTLRMQLPVFTAAASPSGTLIAAGDESGTVTFWDARKTEVQLASLAGLHHDCVRALAFPQEDTGALVASAGDDGRLCIIPGGSSISASKQQVLTPHKSGYIRGLAYGSGRTLYSGSWDASIVRIPL